MNTITQITATRLAGDPTNFSLRLTLAEQYGEKAIRQTYEHLYKRFLKVPEYWAWFVKNLNLKTWKYFAEKNEKYLKVYYELWKQSIDDFRKRYTSQSSDDEVAREIFYGIVG